MALPVKRPLTPAEIAAQQRMQMQQQAMPGAVKPAPLVNPATQRAGFASVAPLPAKAPYDPNNVADVAAGMMGRDSRLMQKSAAEGRAFGNQRGLLNSTIAGQAAQAATLEHIVPMASQTAGQNFTGGQAALDRTHQATEAERQRGFLGSQAGLDRAHQGTQAERERELKRVQAEKDRAFQGTQAGLDRDAQMKRTQAELDVRMKQTKAELDTRMRQTNIDAALREKLAKMEVTTNNQRGVDSLLTNAFNDFENAQQSILSNPELPAAERNKLLENSKRMLESKIGYVSSLYDTTFDWPTNPFKDVAPQAPAKAPAKAPTKTPTVTVTNPALQGYYSRNTDMGGR